MAEWEAERDKCQDCGGPRSECEDPDQDYYAQRTICYRSMSTAAFNAMYDEKYGDKFHDGTFPRDVADWADKRSATHPYGHREGVSVWAAMEDLSPDDDFLKG